jgi:hypothetical protein
VNIASILARAALDGSEDESLMSILQRDIDFTVQTARELGSRNADVPAAGLPLDPFMQTATQFLNLLPHGRLDPVDYKTLQSGQAGLLVTEEWVITSLVERANRVDSRPRVPLWMEAHQYGENWIVYPQDPSLEFRFLLWFPTRVRTGTRLDAIEVPIPGLTTTSATTLRAVRSTGCAPRLPPDGAPLILGCESAGCNHPCEEVWEDNRGIRRLFDCAC